MGISWMWTTPKAIKLIHPLFTTSLENIFYLTLIAVLVAILYKGIKTFGFRYLK